MKIGKIIFFALVISLIIAAISFKTMQIVQINKAFNVAEKSFAAKDYKNAIKAYYQVLDISQDSKKSLIAHYKIYKAKTELKDDTASTHIMYISTNKENYLKEELVNFYTESLYILGSASLEQGNTEEAMEYFKQLLQDTPDSDYADNAVFQIAMIFKKQDRLVEAEKTLKTIIKNYPDTELLQDIQQQSGDINIQLFFRLNSPFTTTHTVKSGDSLASIASKYKTTISYIKKANHMKRSIIRPTDELVVPAVRLSIVIDKSKNTLTLKGDEMILKVFRVGTGQYNKTPVGTFKIINKLVDPPWYSKEGVIPAGDERNLLGTRWLGLNVPSYGIHGTTQPETIGSQSSAGCVRMLNEEVEFLYSIVPEQTEVTIVD